MLDNSANSFSYSRNGLTEFLQTKYQVAALCFLSVRFAVFEPVLLVFCLIPVAPVLDYRNEQDKIIHPGIVISFLPFLRN